MKVSQTLKIFRNSTTLERYLKTDYKYVNTVEYTWKDLFLSWPTTGIVQQAFFTIIRHVKTCKSASNAINVYFTYQYYHFDLFFL